MYKKIMVVFLALLTFSNVHVLAQDERQYFKIYGDSVDSQTVYEVKNELIESYRQLVLGLDASEYSEALKNYFAGQENMSYQNHTLTVILGDGQGVALEGEFKLNYCTKDAEEIETHFFFWELFQGN